MNVAVITPVSGRHEHLALQRVGLSRSTRPARCHVVVGMADPEAAEVARARPGPPVVPVPIDVPDGRLPLAAARNGGAEAALRAAADLLVFLDVDCVPGSGLLRRYVQAAQAAPGRLLCGPVTYLPPPPPGGYDPERLAELTDPHPARPAPADGEVVHDGDPRLFWSLSFAVTAGTWRRVGGFCDLYQGYGGEDTDFGQLAAAAGVGIDWVGGAHAYHQFHPTSDPPVQHLDDVLANARLFHRRWGWWPMTGWLTAFEELGLVQLDPDGGWRRTDRRASRL